MEKDVNKRKEKAESSEKDGDMRWILQRGDRTRGKGLNRKVKDGETKGKVRGNASKWRKTNKRPEGGSEVYYVGKRSKQGNDKERRGEKEDVKKYITWGEEVNRKTGVGSRDSQEMINKQREGGAFDIQVIYNCFHLCFGEGNSRGKRKLVKG